MATVKFVVKGGFSKSLIEIQRAEENFLKEFKKLGEETAEYMKSTINSSKVRPQADEPTDLENNIKVEHGQNSWGVGNIEELDKTAPYWRAVNFGSSHMVGKHLPTGVFDPGEPAPNKEWFRRGRWKKGQDYNGEQYRPIVTQPILPMNYIERTVVWVTNSITNILKSFK